MSLWNERAEAVRKLLAEVRGIETAEGVSMASLNKIGEKLVGLATRTELFPPEHFPMGGDGGIVSGGVDDDGGSVGEGGAGGAPGGVAGGTPAVVGYGGCERAIR